MAKFAPNLLVHLERMVMVLMRLSTMLSKHLLTFVAQTTQANSCSKWASHTQLPLAWTYKLRLKATRTRRQQLVLFLQQNINDELGFDDMSMSDDMYMSDMDTDK
jgi:hypothetical protein